MRASMTTAQIAEKLIDFERDTLTGDYQPFGAHAGAIIDTLQEFGLMDFSGRVTARGELVANYIREENAKTGYVSSI